ncbi:MAG: hypothetical protein ACI93H_001704, partial [Psychromonas sp.]
MRPFVLDECQYIELGDFLWQWCKTTLLNIKAAKLFLRR